MESFFKIRRKSDGLFYGSRKWGQAYSKTGKAYNKASHAKIAVSNAQPKLDPADHEVVEFKIQRTQGIPLSQFMKSE